MTVRFSNYSLRTQIALVFGTLVVAMELLLAIGLGEVLERHIRRDAGNALQIVSGNAAKTLATGLHERSREIEVMAGAADIWRKGLDSAEARHMLARAQAMQPNLLWLGVADTQGVVRSAIGDLLLSNNVAERPWFQQGLQDVHVGDVHPAKLLEKLLPPLPSGEPYRFVDFAAPIRVDGQTVGVLGSHGSWEWTREVLESLTPASTEQGAVELFIFDRNGALILAPHSQSAGTGLPEQPLPPEVGAGTSPQARVARWADGRRYLTAATPLKAIKEASDLGWRIVARQPAEQAFVEARQTARLALLMGLAAALLASVLAWLAARRLSEDLHALARAASDLEAGTTGASIPCTDSSSEVRKLSQALIRMTGHLLAAHEVMEEKVRLRTLALEAANQTLDQQARTDALTGLLNRRGFAAQMELALAIARRSGRPTSIISVDVDHFKRVNDNFGHDAGDLVLQRLARVLAHRLRTSDVIARLGGEEFVALLPDTDTDGAQVIAQAIVDTFAQQEDPVAGRITVSAGVATLRGSGDSGKEMLRRADAALYKAKRLGRSRVCTEH